MVGTVESAALDISCSSFENDQSAAFADGHEKLGMVDEYGSEVWSQ
jgi:hypothetical protein